MAKSSVANKAPTRNDVAKRAKVSTAVVSYVLSGGRAVAPATELRVRNAIEELGYRPNVTARALKTGRTNVLALLIPDVSNPHFAEFALKIEEVATERGYALITASTHDTAATEMRLLEEMRSRGVDGVIIASVFHGDQELPAAYASLPIVFIDALHRELSVPSVGIDLIKGAEMVVKHLVEVHGCKFVALAIGPSSEPSGRPDPRRIGWQNAIEQFGMQNARVVETGWSMEAGVAAAHELLETESRPDAIFAASDLLGIGVLRGAADLGVSVPDGVKVISFDGSPGASFTIPRLSTLRQPVKSMARAAVETILATVPETKAQSLYEGELLLNESCGCNAK